MKNRLFCLDLLRGLDMFLLVAIGPLQNGWRLSFGVPRWWTDQFSHYWTGFTLWDMIQPLFILMCGAAVPFALGKRLKADGRPSRTYCLHVAKRFALLWVLGLVADGVIFKLDITAISPVTNTLQLIGWGYLFAAVVFPWRHHWQRVLPFAAFLVVYGVILFGFGDWTPDGNAGVKFDRWLFSFLYPPESPVFKSNGYSRMLTLPVYGFLTVVGLEATLVLKSAMAAKRKMMTLGLAGSGLAVLGWALTPWIPMIKHIYSPSFTLAAAGYALLLLTALYWLTDIVGFRRGMWLFTLYGQTSLAAYMLYTVFSDGVRKVAENATYGIAGYSETLQPLATAVVGVLLTTWLLYLWRKATLFDHARQSLTSKNGGEGSDSWQLSGGKSAASP